MTKHCECHVISFPATTEQCHWVAVAGTNSIVRYGLGTGGKHEGWFMIPRVTNKTLFCLYLRSSNI